jgi:uncharacterized protein
MRKIAYIFAVFLGTLLYTSAFTVPVKPSGYVNDYAGVLSSKETSFLENEIRAFSASTTNEIAVVVVPDMNGETIENYAIKIFEQWKIGTSKNDNGALLLVAIQERKVRIEVGYGLEGALPDILTKQIIDTQITPEFKKADYFKGISQAVDSIMKATEGEYLLEPTSQSKSITGKMIESILLILFFIVQILSSIFARSKSWWAGGIVGGIIGVTIIIFGIFGLSLVVGSILTVALILFGLMFDYFVSNAYSNSTSQGGGISWWAGGGSGSSKSSSSFGGFSGGSSGGGGSSGSW